MVRSSPFCAWLFCLLLCFASAPVRAEKRVALVIGNSAYRNVAQLDNPANDAKLLADTLSALGFTLVGGGPRLDLDKASFDRVVQEFGAQLAGADVGLFYYAGHGMQIRDANYLVPVDANPTREADVDFQMLDANLVLRQMEGAGTRLNIVILDACRNNPFAGRALAIGQAGINRVRDVGSSGLARMQAPAGTLISFATQPGSIAQDGLDGHSPYARSLAATLRQPGLGLFDTFNQVGLDVQQATGGAQQPWVSSSPIGGAFYFVPPQAVDRQGQPAGRLEAALPQKGPALGNPDRSSSADQETGPIIDDVSLHAFAAKRSIPLPRSIKFTPPASNVPKELAKYLGAFGGDQRWNRQGRLALLVVTKVDSSGAASGFLAWGPPNPRTMDQGAAGFVPYQGKITENGLAFEAFQPVRTHQFKLASDGVMTGAARTAQGNARITIERLVVNEPAAQQASTDVRRFDGVWTVDYVCEGTGSLPELHGHFAGRVINGAFHGEVGEQGKPGSQSYDGTVGLDGSLAVENKGLSGESNSDPFHRAPGTRYSSKLVGVLDGASGTATRTDRDCNFKFAKR